MAYDQGDFKVYSEGTWVPVIVGTVTNPTVTYTTQLGKYTKIGNQVFCKAYIVIATISGGSGAFAVSAPFTISGTFNNYPGPIITSGVALVSGTNYNLISMDPGFQSSICRTIRDNAGTSFVAPTDLAAGDTIKFSSVFNI